MDIKDLLFPKTCIGCGFIGVYLCDSCAKKLRPSLPDTCPYCQKQSPYGFTHGPCKRKFGLDSCMSLFRYDGFMQKIVKSIKYRLAREVWDDVWRMIGAYAIERLCIWNKLRLRLVVQPIPVSNSRKKARGFNQSLIIAQTLCSFLGFPVVDILQKKDRGFPQAQITNMRLRLTNVKDSFLFSGKRSANPHILLIDDVCTSGATLKEAARVLKKTGGVERVFACTVAKG